MIPRTAQDLSIEHRAGVLTLLTRSHRSDDTETVR